MGVKIVLPKSAKNNGLSTCTGTKVYIEGQEIKDVSAIDFATWQVDSILTASITVPIDSIVYADE